MNKKINNPSSNLNLVNFAILIGLSIVWGSSFILIKKALIAFSPEQVASLRISISALAFLPVVLWNWKKIDWSKWKWLLVVGSTGSAIPAFLFSNAQMQLSSTITGILNSLSPLFTLTFGILLFGAAVIKRKVAGVLLGLFGAIIMTAIAEQGDMSGNLLYGLLVVCAAACYGLSANVVSFKLKEMKSLYLSAASFCMVGLPAIIYLLFYTDFPERMVMNENAQMSLYAILFLALIGTVVASVIFYYLIKKTSALFGSTVAYLMPIVSIAWGFFDGEIINLWHFAGMGLILGGVYLSRN
ncbi:MAG: drug/metabolite transporter (DMT)-like permease [Saprospiraceae bacterium]|jgi:drug/metabolite transporter (DMT)-like permease